jgi:hypothetical protein
MERLASILEIDKELQILRPPPSSIKSPPNTIHSRWKRNIELIVERNNIAINNNRAWNNILNTSILINNPNHPPRLINTNIPRNHGTHHNKTKKQKNRALANKANKIMNTHIEKKHQLQQLDRIWGILKYLEQYYGMNMVSLLAKIYVYTPPADLIQDIALISAIVITFIVLAFLLTVRFIEYITERGEQAIETRGGDGNAAKDSTD